MAGIFLIHGYASLHNVLSRCRPLHPVGSDLARDRHYCAGYVPHSYRVPFW